MSIESAITISLAIATFALAFATAAMVAFASKSAKASEAAVKEMQTDREERNKPHPYLLRYRSERWPFSVDYPLYLRIDEFHMKAHAEWQDLRWNIIIIRNVGKGETGPGKVGKIEYNAERPKTIKADDLEGFELRSILPGESYAKLFAVQETDRKKEDTPRVRFTYECDNLPGVVFKYPPKGKTDDFIDVYPETRVKLVKD